MAAAVWTLAGRQVSVHYLAGAAPVKALHKPQPLCNSLAAEPECFEVHCAIPRHLYDVPRAPHDLTLPDVLTILKGHGSGLVDACTQHTLKETKSQAQHHKLYDQCSIGAVPVDMLLP